MKRGKNLILRIIAAVGLATVIISGSALAQQTGTKCTEFQRHDISVSGREAIQFRVDFAPGYKFGKHTHLGEELVYVLEGLIEYEIEGKPLVTLKAGDVFFIPAGTIHSAKNVGTFSAVELAT